MDKYIKCYFPPVNISQLGNHILIPESNVYDYTKKLYEQGLEHKVTPPQREHELQEFFSWKVKYMSQNKMIRRMIDWLMG